MCSSSFFRSFDVPQTGTYAPTFSTYIQQALRSDSATEINTWYQVHIITGTTPQNALRIRNDHSSVQKYCYHRSGTLPCQRTSSDRRYRLPKYVRLVRTAVCSVHSSVILLAIHFVATSTYIRGTVYTTTRRKGCMREGVHARVAEPAR